MPTYSYSCTECGHRFDAVQTFSDDALTTCPQCSGRLRKLFKGSGFYRTDSRETAKSSTNGSAKSSESTSSSENSSSTSTNGSASGSTSSAPAAAASS